MKAILAHAFGGPEVLKYEEAEDPKAGPGEVVIDIKAAGINPADTYMRGGAYAIKPDLPYTPGGDGWRGCGDRPRRYRVCDWRCRFV